MLSCPKLQVPKHLICSSCQKGSNVTSSSIRRQFSNHAIFLTHPVLQMHLNSLPLPVLENNYTYYFVQTPLMRSSVCTKKLVQLFSNISFSFMKFELGFQWNYLNHEILNKQKSVKNVFKNGKAIPLQLVSIKIIAKGVYLT